MCSMTQSCIHVSAVPAQTPDKFNRTSKKPRGSHYRNCPAEVRFIYALTSYNLHHIMLRSIFTTAYKYWNIHMNAYMHVNTCSSLTECCMDSVSKKNIYILIYSINGFPAWSKIQNYTHMYCTYKCGQRSHKHKVVIIMLPLLFFF